MTLHKSIEAAREALNKLSFIWVTIQSNGKPKIGFIEYGENEQYFKVTDVYEALSTLPTEPMTEEEILKLIDVTYVAEPQRLIKTLRDAGVLYVGEKS